MARISLIYPALETFFAVVLTGKETNCTKLDFLDGLLEPRRLRLTGPDLLCEQSKGKKKPDSFLPQKELGTLVTMDMTSGIRLLLLGFYISMTTTIVFALSDHARMIGKLSRFSARIISFHFMFTSMRFWIFCVCVLIAYFVLHKCDFEE